MFSAYFYIEFVQHCWGGVVMSPISQLVRGKAWFILLQSPHSNARLQYLYAAIHGRGPSTLFWKRGKLISSYWSEKKSINKQCWRGCREKGTLLHYCWECKLVQPLWKQYVSSLKKKKLKIESPYDPPIPPLGIYLEKMKTLIWKVTYTPMFITALFIIAKT